MLYIYVYNVYIHTFMVSDHHYMTICYVYPASFVRKLHFPGTRTPTSFKGVLCT